jgi:hypothetical protein
MRAHPPPLRALPARAVRPAIRVLSLRWRPALGGADFARIPPRGAGVTLIDFVSAFDSLLHGTMRPPFATSAATRSSTPSSTTSADPSPIPPRRGRPASARRAAGLPPQPDPLQLRPQASPPLPAPPSPHVPKPSAPYSPSRFRPSPLPPPTAPPLLRPPPALLLCVRPLAGATHLRLRKAALPIVEVARLSRLVEVACTPRRALSSPPPPPRLLPPPPGVLRACRAAGLCRAVPLRSRRGHPLYPLPLSPVYGRRQLRPRLPRLCSLLFLASLLYPPPPFVTLLPNLSTHYSFIQEFLSS